MAKQVNDSKQHINAFSIQITEMDAKSNEFHTNQDLINMKVSEQLNNYLKKFDQTVDNLNTKLSNVQVQMNNDVKRQLQQHADNISL